MIEQVKFGFNLLYISKCRNMQALLLPCQKCVDIFKNAFELFVPKLASF